MPSLARVNPKLLIHSNNQVNFWQETQGRQGSILLLFLNHLVTEKDISPEVLL